MSDVTKRVNQIFEGQSRKIKTIITPEGAPITVQIANRGERFAAFFIDILIMFATIILLWTLFFYAVYDKIVSAYYYDDEKYILLFYTLVSFSSFIIRNLYFIHFEMTSQGRTPGKRIKNLRVINRHGGELTPGAVVARNLMREVEFFFPIQLLLALPVMQLIGDDLSTAQILGFLSWVIGIALVPLFSADTMRAGDFIAGTIVIATPKRLLKEDLAEKAAADASSAFAFSQEHLSIYGAFELQVLEELLRQPDHAENQKTLEQICTQICAKINWPDRIAPKDIRAFLTQFYRAERADLERRQLFGEKREDKNHGKRQP